MAVSSSRLTQLREEFIPVKNQIDKIDRKYSLDYVEPLIDMPESLNLPLMEYEAKDERQLMQLADEQTYASFLAGLNRLESSNASNMRKLDKQQLALEEKTRLKIAQLLNNLNESIQEVNVKITNAGMLFSTVAERVKFKLQREYESKVAETNQSADNEMRALAHEREQVEANYNEALSALKSQRKAQVQAAFNKLKDAELAEQKSVQKYNNTLTEKEKKYQMARAKALEAARQAEYDRSYAAKKLYQQMGSVGYEENMLWEKYNVFVKHFANFTKREEALILIQGDNYVQGHLKQYYTTLIDWVNRHVPA